MKYDVIVGGAGPAGICAAIAAKRGGANVLLIENSGLLGGTNILSLVGPLMTYHNMKNQVIKGIAEEIIERLKKINGTLGHITDPLGFCSTVTPIDTEALKRLYFELIQENDIDLLLHTKIIGAHQENGDIKYITVANKEGVYNIEATYFIDATGDGDIAHYASAQYIIGRTSDNLCQPMTMPFVVSNVDVNKLLDEVKNNPDNFVIHKNYDYKYLGISGFFNEVTKAKNNGDFNINRDRVLLFQNVLKNEVTINMTRVNKYSALSAIERTKAEIEGRNQIQEVFNFLVKYVPGFEKSYISQTPHQIGIRETRHILCDYMITKEDVLEHKKFDDAICVSAFPMDIHSPDSASMEFDDESSAENLAFEIPLRSILPIGLNNLIVTGRMIGATHEAAASLRVCPVCMALGEAAGSLASIANKENVSIREVEYNTLSKHLNNNNHITKI